MVDLMQDDDIGFDSMRTHFERELQNLNTKLTVFADKIKDIDSFPIK